MVLCKTSLKAIIHGLYYSITTYGVISWRNATKTLMKPLKNIHQKNIIVVYNKH